jgi:hypothetical protein
MIYFYQNKNVVQPFDSHQKDFLAYPDIQDLRNYAFLYIHSDNEIEGVIRTSNLTEHYYALMPLSNQSAHLKPFRNVLIDDDTHYYFDEAVCKEGTLQIYYSTSDLRSEDTFGYINVPAVLTEFQKQFIRNHLPYFEVYQDILVNQFDHTTNSLQELNFMMDGTFLQVLRELSETPEVIHGKRH